MKYNWKYTKYMVVCIYVVYCDIIVPDTRVGRCLGPKGSGDSSRGGDEGGLGPASKEGDKQPAPSKGDKQPAPNNGDNQSTPSMEGGNMEKEEEEKKSQAFRRGTSVHRVSIFKGPLSICSNAH